EVRDHGNAQRQQHPVLSAQDAACRHQQKGQRGEQKGGLECVSHSFDTHSIRWSAGERDASPKCGRERPRSCLGTTCNHVETAASGPRVERSSTASQGWLKEPGKIARG